MPQMGGERAEIPKFAEMDTEFEQTLLVDRQSGVPVALAEIRIGKRLDPKIVGD